MKNKDISVNWDKYAEQYDSITMSGTNPSYINLFKKVIQHFEEQKIKENSLIIDLGGGTGNFTIGSLTDYWNKKGIPSIAERNPKSKFVIVDMSEGMLELAIKKAKKLNLKNVDVIKHDVEDIKGICDIYSKPIDHAIMMHCLYATRSKEDKDKPQRILNNIYKNLEKEGSFFISDINRKINTGNWIPYCLANAVWRFKSFSKAIDYFNENDQAKLANRHIDINQNRGDYLLCSLEDLIKMHEKAGFKRENILEASDKFYRKRDNLIRIRK